MTDDLLRKATEALREESDAAADEGARFTRARVMASVHKSEVRRRTRVAFALPIAACFAAATAWGTVNGKTQAIIADVGEALGFTPKAAVPPAPKPKATSRRSAPPATEPAAPSDAPAESPEALAVNDAAKDSATQPSAPNAQDATAPNTPNSPSERRSSSAAREPSATRAAAENTPPVASAAPEAAPPKSTDAPAGSASAKLDISDRAHELYRTAHRWHFVEHDYSAALTAWDTYLREAPGGRFALEARYNRALCLVRLGRNAEARAALTPFAAGELGGYRQREATGLMDALK